MSESPTRSMSDGAMKLRLQHQTAYLPRQQTLSTLTQLVMWPPLLNRNPHPSIVRSSNGHPLRI